MAALPNVYLLSADSLRADHAEELMNRVAERTGGTRFTNAVAPASHTASSVPGLLTGQYIDGNGPGDGKPLPESLGADEYQTQVVTDNPLIGSVLEQDTGSNNAKGLENVLDDLLPRGLTRSIERWYFRWAWPMARRYGLANAYYRPAGLLHETAIDSLSDVDGPSFSWVHYMDTHSPYHVPRGAESTDVSGRYRTAATSRRIALERPEAVSKEDLASVSRLYRTACSELGDSVVDFVEQLIEDGQYRPETDILAVTADHGECLDTDRGMVGHVPPASWESLVHVPLVVARPDWPETEVAEQVSLVDLPAMLGADIGETRAPATFSREYAVTVAGSLTDVGTVRGVRRDNGTKLFGRRTDQGVDVVQTMYDVGDPSAETVVSTWSGDDTAAGAPTDLTDRLRDMGGVVEHGSYLPGFDEEQLRSLGYLE